MKRMLCAFVLGCLVINAFAEDEVLTIQCTHARSSVDQKAFPFMMRPFGIQEAGYEFSYVITGTNIVEVKADSLAITKLALKDGTDISKTARGRPSYKIAQAPAVDGSGVYARFIIQVAHDDVIATELPTIEGSITVVVTEGEETETVTLERGDEKPHTVGNYTVTVTEDDLLTVTVTGAKRGIVKVEASSGGKALRSRGHGTSSSGNITSMSFSSSTVMTFPGSSSVTVYAGEEEEEDIDMDSIMSRISSANKPSPVETATYVFAKPTADDITVNLTLRKGRKEQVLNF